SDERRRRIARSSYQRPRLDAKFREVAGPGLAHARARAQNRSRVGASASIRGVVVKDPEDHGATIDASQIDGEHRAHATDLIPGQTFAGRYEIDSLVGRGGM